MTYCKRHFRTDIWTEKSKYPKNRETLKFTAYILLLFCSIWIIFSLLFPFTPLPDDGVAVGRIHGATAFTAMVRPPLPRKCHGNFSVYVYDLPPEFNRGMLRNCQYLNIYTDMCPHVANNGLGQPLRRGSAAVEEEYGLGGGRGVGGGELPLWFATHQFIAEMIFHARVENHPCRTWEPERADIFYVPFYGGLYASSVFRENNLTKRDELAVRLIDYISQQPWWRKNNGHDHFLALGRTAWDFMRTSDGPDFGANILLNLPRVKNMSVLTVERQPWKGSNHFGIPYSSYFHPSTSAQMVTWQSKVRRAERPHLFCFVGGPRKGLEKAAIRDELIRQCAESSRCQLLKCESGGSRCHDPNTVLSVMARSRFCLQAPGDSFTRRSTFDAMLAGCIPVFFSPHTAYSQYAWYLPNDWRKYSVFLDQEKSRRIEDELSMIPENKELSMKKNVISLIPSLTYAHPNATRYGLRDAVDVALEALAERVRTSVGRML